MKKIQLAEEAGRSMAQKRYGGVDSQSKYGHSQMGRNVKSKFQFARGGGVSTKTDYGDPVGPPGETDKDFSDMESEDAAVSVRVRPDQNAGFSRSKRGK